VRHDNKKEEAYASDARFKANSAYHEADAVRELPNLESLMKRPKELLLVVEDFEDSRFMMLRLLEMSGYRVLEASDGEQAVEVAVRKRPALILMDLSLPKLDGLAATRKLRQNKTMGKVPIVAVSAHDAPESRIEALEAGCDDYVTKPIDFDHLNALVKRLLSRDGRSYQARKS
jgi:two-component system cell cycle response regulator DivK